MHCSSIQIIVNSKNRLNDALFFHLYIFILFYFYLSNCECNDLLEMSRSKTTDFLFILKIVSLLLASFFVCLLFFG